MFLNQDIPTPSNLGFLLLACLSFFWNRGSQPLDSIMYWSDLSRTWLLKHGLCTGQQSVFYRALKVVSEHVEV